MMTPDERHLVSLLIRDLSDDEGGDSAFEAALAKISNLNDIDTAGYTVIHSVVGISGDWSSDEVRRIRRLLEAGCDPNIPDLNLVTPISRVAGCGSEQVVRLLLEFGANPCLKDKSGESAVVWATRITPFDYPVLSALFEGIKAISPDIIPNEDWLLDRTNRMIEPYTSAKEQAEAVSFIRGYYPTFHPEFKAEQDA